MFCTECGSTLGAGAIVCSNCDAPVDDVLSDAVYSDPIIERPANDAHLRDAPAPPDDGNGYTRAAALPERIAFGDWLVTEVAVVSSRGVIPLDQVSCSTYDATPLNKRYIVLSVLIALAGLSIYITMQENVGVLIGLIGGVGLYFSLQAKRAYRLYSTSGYYFEGNTQEMDMGGERIREFERFNAALLDYRDRYISSFKV